MARKKKDASAPGPPPVAGWMATYGDMVTNMLCFFVMMLAMSNVDAEKAKAVAESFATVFGGTAGILNNNIGILPDFAPPNNGEGEGQGEGEEDNEQQDVVFPEDLAAEQAREMEEIIDKLQSGNSEGLLDSLELKPSERGVIVRLSSSILFEASSATLSAEARRLLDQIIPGLKDISNALWIEGHTCDLPINTAQFPSNWELSSARALAVLHYLEDNGIDPRRLGSTGKGEYQNIVPNTTEANRQRNRRVDIVIVSNRTG